MRFEVEGAGLGGLAGCLHREKVFKSLGGVGREWVLLQRVRFGVNEMSLSVYRSLLSKAVIWYIGRRRYNRLHVVEGHNWRPKRVIIRE